MKISLEEELILAKFKEIDNFHSLDGGRIIVIPGIDQLAGVEGDGTDYICVWGMLAYDRAKLFIELEVAQKKVKLLFNKSFPAQAEHLLLISESPNIFDISNSSALMRSAMHGALSLWLPDHSYYDKLNKLANVINAIVGR